MCVRTHYTSLVAVWFSGLDACRLSLIVKDVWRKREKWVKNVGTNDVSKYIESGY